MTRFLSDTDSDGKALIQWLDERLSRGQRAEVEDLFDELPEPLELPTESYTDLIEASYRAQLFEQGLKLAETWREREPASPRPLNHAARLHSLAGRHEQAHELHRLALSLDADRAESCYQLGCTLLREERLEEAEAAFRQALALAPRMGKAYTNLGFALDRRGESERAIQQFKRAIQLDPFNAMGHMNLGALYGERG